MRLIVGAHLISFHSERILITAIRYRKNRTVPIECQLVLESKLELLLQAAQDVGQIADKLGKVQGTCLGIKLKLPTDPRMVPMCHGSVATGFPIVCSICRD